jgi:outer membrane protein assembly factor BamB
MPLPRSTYRFLLLAPAAVVMVWSGTSNGQSGLCGSPADELVAARVGLDREWVVQVPFDSAAWRLEHVVVGDRLVVAQAGDGTVAAIRADVRPGGARRGTVAWSQRVGGTGPFEAPGIGEKTVVVARSRGVTALFVDTGRVAWNLRLAGIASAGGMSSAGNVFVPLDGSGVDRLPEDIWEEGKFEARTSETAPVGESASRFVIDSKGEVDFSPTIFEDGVLWCSADGLIVAMVGVGDRARRLEFELGAPASGPPVVVGRDVYVATRAGDIARIASVSAGLTANAGVYRNAAGQDVKFSGWHTVLEAVPEGSPVVGGNTVVLSLGAWGIAGFNAANGDLRWQVPDVGLPVAITDARVWCLDATGFLVARDLMSGGRRERLCLGDFTIPVVNTKTERLVLASPKGLVTSLAPRTVATASPVVPPPAPAPEAPAEPAGDAAAAADDNEA